jgi:hypothetical protein
MSSEEKEPPQSPLRAFLTAVAFLTRIPVPALVGSLHRKLEFHRSRKFFSDSSWKLFLFQKGHEPVWLGRSTQYFPIVGALIGWSAGIVFLATSTFWNPFTSAALSFAFTVYITVRREAPETKSRRVGDFSSTIPHLIFHVSKGIIP